MRTLNTFLAIDGAATRHPSRTQRLASDARWSRPGCLVAGTVAACESSNTLSFAGKVAGGAWAGRIGAAEEHRASGRARSALRQLIRRICLSAVSEANVASYATGRKAEHRRAPSRSEGKPLSPVRAPLAALLAQTAA